MPESAVTFVRNTHLALWDALYALGVTPVGVETYRSLYDPENIEPRS